MPSSYTENYRLNQWSRDDRVLMDDFNTDNAKIDGAIRAVDQRVDGLNGSKADKTALTALSQTVAGKGNCQIVFGQYTGNGVAGWTGAITLTFEKQPFMLLVFNQNDTMIAMGGSGSAHIVQSGSSQLVSANWEGTTVSWWNNGYHASASEQMNAEGTVYRYVAFLAL